MIGKSIGRYKIIDKLGEGGMGTVWKAEDTTLDRLVALKSLSRTVDDDPEARERFIREAQAASALNHPNITTVHDLLEDEDRHFICMEYVEGKTARDMVESGRVGVKKALEIILQTAEALETAHHQGILHRDIKSSNIMVTMEGRVKVLDFGLAHLEERSQLTRTGTTMGTLAYSSPEQLTGAGYDQRSEIWALGVVLYELLTTRLPFSSASEGELVFAIINNEQEPPSTFREDLPETVGNIIIRMLEKDPGERYQNCSELISDLKSVQGGLETSTVSRTLQTGIRKRKYHPAIWATLSAVLIAGAGVLITSLPRYEPGYTLIVQFLDGTRDDSLESLALGGPEQLKQLLSASGRVSGVDIHEFQAGSEEITAQQSLSERQILQIAKKHRADLIITASYRFENEALVLRPNIHSRSQNRSWPLPAIRGSASDTRSLMDEVSNRIVGMVAFIQDDEYRVLEPLIGYPPSLQAYLSMSEALHVFYSGHLGEAIPQMQQVWQENPGYIRPLLWLARWAEWETKIAELDSLLNVINNSGIQLDGQEEAFRQLLLRCSERNRDASYRAALNLQELAPGTYWNYEAAKWAVLTQRPSKGLEFLKGIYPEAELLKNSPHATRWMMSLAYNKLGMHEEAFQTIFELRDLGLGQYPYYEVLCLGAMGRLEDIVARFEEGKSTPYPEGNIPVPVIIPFPGGPPAGHLAVGGIRLREYGHRAESFEALRMAIDWYSTQDPELYKPSIAECYYWAGEWQEAEGLFIELAEEYPENDAFTFRLATIAARTGNQDQAHTIYNQIIRLDSANPSVLFRLSSLAALLGDKDTAVGHLRGSLDRGLNWRDDIKRNIDFESLRGYPPFEHIFELKQ